MKLILSFLIALLFANVSNSQLLITTQNNAQALAQRLVGDGVTISNVTLSGDSISTGFFRNISGTSIGLDSGIVLTNGRAKTISTSDFEIGLDGDGVTPANDFSGFAFADNQVNYDAHDADLAQLINIDAADTHDATVLEFDFVPAGDSVKFKYVFSSEEYPEFACPIGGGTLFNDAFAFFIQGPGFPVKTNIALIPGTSDPVTIHNINDQGCAPYPQYYINNETNVNFTHNGHTVILTAFAAVQACQTYHLKLVIADVQDDAYDSGVFLEAKSLTSNIVRLTNNTQTDASNNSYIVEGCQTGSFTIKRPNVTNSPLPVAITYAGTAINGVDVQTLPAVVTIPANDSVVTVNVIPIIDNIPEGIETIKVYVSTGCSLAITDSAIIQIRDYDTLSITPANSVFICKNGSIPLHASAAWSTFVWDAVPGLDDYTSGDPVATPVQNAVNYICTANVGTCNGRDSVFIQWKELELNSQQNVNCNNGTTGQIVVSGGPEWTDPPVQYSINNQPPQAGGTFNNIPVGNYTVHITDGSGCMDDVPVNIIQAYPDLLINNNTVGNATCATTSLGSITVTAGGGLAPYQYSIDGINFQTSNIFNVPANTYTITVNDANDCPAVFPGVVVPFINDLTLSVSADTSICSGQSVFLHAVSSADTYSWSPTTDLNNPNIQSPVSTPNDNITYTVTATLGGCVQTAAVQISVSTNLTVDAGGPLNIDAGGSAQVLANVGGSNTNISSILWTASAGLSATNILNPVVTPIGTNGTTTYTITVKNTTGCSASDILIINIIPNCINIRNAFTPNGDGINDSWKVYDDYSCLKNVTVHVFNRYGSKVFESDDYRNNWEGRYNGKPLPDGTYYAVIEFTTLTGKKKTVKTDLTILR
ncbi:MAG: choice-of-anchor L domain-containing protein [Ferruginibacter sp.]